MSGAILSEYRVYCVNTAQYETTWNLSPPVVCPLHGDTVLASETTVLYEAFLPEPVSVASLTYNLNQGEPYVQVDATAENVTLVLPPAAGSQDQVYVVEKTGGGNNVVLNAPTDLVDFFTTKAVTGVAVVTARDGTWTTDVDQITFGIENAEQRTTSVFQGRQPFNVSVSDTVGIGAQLEIEHPSDPRSERQITVWVEDTVTEDDATFGALTTSGFTVNNPSESEITNGTFALSINPPSTTTTNLSLGATAFATTATNPASNANDNSTSSFWYNTTAQDPTDAQWWCDVGQLAALYSVEIEWFSSTYYADEVVVDGSADGVNWTELHTESGISYSSVTTFAVPGAPLYYRWFRLRFPGAVQATYVVAREIRFLGGIPQAGTVGTTDTYITSSVQMVTATWQTVNSVAVTSTETANTTILYLVSFDGANSWEAWNGASWGTVALGSISTSPMTTSLVTSANYNAKLQSSIRLAVFISTSAASDNPQFSGLRFNYSTSAFQRNPDAGEFRFIRVSDTMTAVQNRSTAPKTITANLLVFKEL